MFRGDGFRVVMRVWLCSVPLTGFYSLLGVVSAWMANTSEISFLMRYYGRLIWGACENTLVGFGRDGIFLIGLLLPR